ncbi:MAG: hypothetical protein JW827_01640 [Spirochaetes bacterium]|nr:hypothetical protein [Spirochaetota bacterium]
MKGMTIIVKKVTQIIAGVIFLYGLYITIQGHLSPGGGFAGGTIIAGSFILLVLAFGNDVLGLVKKEIRSSFIEALGIFLFILTASGAIILSFYLNYDKIFFKNFLTKGVPGEIVSAGFIPLLNIFIGMEVAAALFTLFLAFVIKSEEKEEKKK